MLTTESDHVLNREASNIFFNPQYLNDIYYYEPNSEVDSVYLITQKKKYREEKRMKMCEKGEKKIIQGRMNKYGKIGLIHLL